MTASAGRPALRRLPWERTWIALVLAALLIAAVALRGLYTQRISLFFDEYISLYAARIVLQRGLPLFPSGNFYTHGLLFVYLEALVLKVAGLDETILRLPSLLLSAGTVVALFFIGRRLFSGTAGLVAAAAAAVDPEAIIWGGRARMYSLLQLLALLAVWVFYEAAIAGDHPRRRWLAMGLLVAAIFSQVEAGLLLPALGVALLVARGPKWCLRPSVIGPFLLGLAGFAIVVSGGSLGEASHLEQIGEVRPYLTLPGSNLLGGLKGFAPAFLDVWRLPFSLLSAAGLIVLFRRPGRRSAWVYFYLVLAVVLAALLFLAGPTWQVPRYAFMLLPALWLTAGAALERGLRPLAGRCRGELPCAPTWPGALVAVGLALLVGFTGFSTAFTQEWGYDLAFRHVQREWQPGDVVLTTNPPASALYLGQCDYYVMQFGWGEDLMEGPQGGQVDRWTGAPLLNSVGQLEEVLATGRRVWLVVDGWRFQSWFENAFIRTVLDQMVLTHDERGMAVFRGQGYAERPPPAASRSVAASFGDELALERVELSAAALQPGEELEVSLAWRALAAPRPAYTTFLHLTGSDGVRVAQRDEPLLGGFYQPTLWPKDQPVLDRHRLLLPDGLTPGRYRLDAGLYLPGEATHPLSVEGGGDRVVLGFVTVGELPAVPAPAARAGVEFGPLEGVEEGSIRLEGYTLRPDLKPLPGGSDLELELVWEAASPVGHAYTVFVHLVAPDGSIVAQDDAPPGGDFYPTTFWQPGERIPDRHRLAMPSGIPAGEYRLLVGLYLNLPPFERLPTAGLDGAWPLASVQVGGP